MSQAARDLIGAVGDLRNRCNLMLDHLRDVENTVTGYEQYDDETEMHIAGASSAWGGAAHHYIDSAIASVDQMLRMVHTALEAEPANRRR